MLKRLAQETSHILKFIITGFPLTLLALILYFPGTGIPDHFLGWWYAMSIPSYYFLLILILSLLLAPFCFLGPARYVIILPKACIDSFLFLNVLVFNVYRVHIDPIFLYLIMYDFRGIGIPPHAIALACIAFSFIVLVNLILFRKAAVLLKPPAAIFPVILCLFLSGQLLHIWGFEYNQPYITRYTPHFPYYFPTKSSGSMHAAAKMFPDIIPGPSRADEPDIHTRRADGAVFQYPLQKLSCTPPGKKFNILFFIVESWRSDMMDDRMTPVINGFARKCSLFTNHISGGSVTHSGLFSIMYGLHPTYLKYAEMDPVRYPPVFMQVLNENGYITSVYTTSNLNGFSLKTLFFRSVKQGDYREQWNQNCVTGDRIVINELLQSIREQKSGPPRFRFVFLTSSHHGYEYPPAHSVYRPTARESFFIVNKHTDPVPILNRYKNSLHYTDALFGEVLSALKETHLDKDTVIVITSDHGEEFNDKGYGYWEHGSNYSRCQTSVPLIMYFPDDGKGRIITKRSSHVDIAPTLLRHLFGCRNALPDYSSGEDLFRLPDHRNLIVMSYVNKAYLIDDTVYSEGIIMNCYSLDDIRRKVSQYRYKDIKLLKEAESHFLK